MVEVSKYGQVDQDMMDFGEMVRKQAMVDL